MLTAKSFVNLFLNNDKAQALPTAFRRHHVANGRWLAWHFSREHGPRRGTKHKNIVQEANGVFNVAGVGKMQTCTRCLSENTTSIHHDISPTVSGHRPPAPCLGPRPQALIVGPSMCHLLVVTHHAWPTRHSSCLLWLLARSMPPSNMQTRQCLANQRVIGIMKLSENLGDVRCSPVFGGNLTCLFSESRNSFFGRNPNTL